MSGFAPFLYVLGTVLLVLCALVGVMNIYVTQPITLLRYGRAGLKDLASPAVLVGDTFFALGSVCLLATQNTQSGRDVILWMVLPIWLMNPYALPWLCVMGWIAVAYYLVKRPTDGVLSGAGVGDWIALLVLLGAVTWLFVGYGLKFAGIL